MSDPVYTNTNRSPSLLGDHDTGLYDPDRHDNRIVAVYETLERAKLAQGMLKDAGVPETSIQMLDQSQMVPTTPAGDATDQGVWGAIKSLFLSDEDAHSYEEGVRRGHIVLSVDPSNAPDRHKVIEVLEGTDPIDFDARLEEWRQAGYSYPDAATGDAAVSGAAGVPGSAAAVQGKREDATGAVRVRSYVAQRGGN